MSSFLSGDIFIVSGTGILEFLTIFILAVFVGNEVVSRVPSILHTPLMSGSNAIHGIVLVGAMIIMGTASGTAQMVLGFFAVLLATLNIVGGFTVTDRMLEMFKAKPADNPGPGKGKGKGKSADVEDGAK